MQEREYIWTEARQQFRQHAGASDADEVAALVSVLSLITSIARPLKPLHHYLYVMLSRSASLLHACPFPATDAASQPDRLEYLEGAAWPVETGARG